MSENCSARGFFDSHCRSTFLGSARLSRQ